MATISQAVSSNEHRIEKYGNVKANLDAARSAPPVRASVIAPGRSVFPSRGSLPYNIVQATDYEAATGFTSQRLRARTMLASTSKLLS